MYNEKIEALIKAALADGVLTEKEKQILFKNARAQGIDLDEFEMVLDAKLEESRKKIKTSVDKCPACGAIVPPNTKVCLDCGLVFSNEESDIKEIIQLQDNYVMLCEFKPKFPSLPIYLAVYIVIIWLNAISWIFAMSCNLLWLLVCIPLTVVTIIAMIIRMFATRKDKKNLTVFDPAYNTIIGKHKKLMSTAKSFYSQDKLLNNRIDAIDDDVNKIVEKNKKTNKIFTSISYGVFLFIVTILFFLSFGWFSKTLDRHSFERTSKLIKNAIADNDIVSAERYYQEFQGDENYGGAEELTLVLLNAFIELDDEEKILYYSKKIIVFNKYLDCRKVGVDTLIDYYISKKQYQFAIDIFNGDVRDVYIVIEKCVKYLVRKNQYDKAIQLIKTNSYLFNGENSESEYYKPKVVRMLTGLTQK